jgi:hypothetical protein
MTSFDVRYLIMILSVCSLDNTNTHRVIRMPAVQTISQKFTSILTSEYFTLYTLCKPTQETFMKHPLKTLLITSVLTLPTTSGANAAGYQATLNEEAQQRGVQTQAASIKGTFWQLPVDLRDSIFGVLTPDRSKTNKTEPVVFTLGYLDILDIYRLARTTRALNKKLQPILRAAKALNPTLFLSKVLPNMSIPSKKPTVLNLNDFEKLGVMQYPGSFDDILGILLDVLYTPKPAVTPEEIEIAKASIHSLQVLSEKQKNVLVSLLKPSTTSDIINASKELATLGKAYYNIAASLYESSSSLGEATPYDLVNAGINLIKLGSTYRDRGAGVLVKIASHPLARPMELHATASELRSLWKDNHALAAKLYEDSAYCRFVTSDDIRRAAQGLRNLGSAYHDKADKLRELANEKESRKS